MITSQSRWWIAAATIVLIAVGLSFGIERLVPTGALSLGEEEFLGSSLGFFLLINVTLVVVLVLSFITIKNLVKLVLDRRRKLLGSRLRFRLVLAFLGLSLVPTVLLFLVARGLVSSVLQGWFAPQIIASVDGAVGVAKYHLQSLEGQLFRNLHTVSGELLTLLPYVQNSSGNSGEVSERVLRRYLEEKREEHGLFYLALVDRVGSVVAEASSIERTHGTTSLPGINRRAVEEAQAGTTAVHPESSPDGEFIRGYAPVRLSPLDGVFAPWNGGTAVGNAEFVLTAVHSVAPELNRALSSVIDAYDDYRELHTFRNPLGSTYTLILAAVTIMIVFAAIWVGFYLARGLTVPIQQLAAGTEEVAHGNLAHRIPEVGDDELSVLVRSFNKMTSDLSATTVELVAKRRYIETVLAHVGVGVVSVERDKRITTFNLTAAEMLELGEPERFTGKALQAVLPPEFGVTVVGLLDELFDADARTLSANASVHQRETTRHFQLTVSKLVAAQGEVIGAVLLLDDLTELVSAQRMAAWREVAKRIAHEIKNPLTPIQLSAQRIRRRLDRQKSDLPEEDLISERATIAECADTISQQVETLRTLVNEFSKFARMPKATPQPVELGVLLQETVAIYREAHPEIKFLVDIAAGVPLLELDREQIGRAIVNLLDNAVSSVHEVAAADWAANEKCSSEGHIGQPQISVCCGVDTLLSVVTVAVSDNGIGVSDRDKTKLFEPYFSTKKGGTGLGLAIVSTIVSDHNGFIRVRDNSPRGAVFVVELPLPVQRAARALG